MARPRQNTISYEQNVQKNFIREIEVRCVYVGMKSNDALGKAIGVTGRTVINHKEDPGKMQVCVLQKMIKVLKLDPSVVLQFLGYSTQDIRKFAKEYTQ